ncbi:hypothetical protein ACQKML_08115 [Peribacillus frigoritolerans]
MNKEQKEAIHWAMDRLEKGITQARGSINKNKDSILFGYTRGHSVAELERRIEHSENTVRELKARKKVFEEMLDL